MSPCTTTRMIALQFSALRRLRRGFLAYSPKQVAPLPDMRASRGIRHGAQSARQDVADDRQNNSMAGAGFQRVMFADDDV